MLASMALLHRITATLVGAAIPVTAIGAGCGDKIADYNALGNEATNHLSPAGGGGLGGAHGTGSSGSTGTGNLMGLGLCACALGIEAPVVSPACTTCANNAVGGNGACVTAAIACDSAANNTACHASINCVKNCQGDPACVAVCLTSPALSQQYVNLLNCTCQACGMVCPPQKPVSACVPPDGGADAAQGG
jgi:hypothetical protein